MIFNRYDCMHISKIMFVDDNKIASQPKCTRRISLLRNTNNEDKSKVLEIFSTVYKIIKQERVMVPIGTDMCIGGIQLLYIMLLLAITLIYIHLL